MLPVRFPSASEMAITSQHRFLILHGTGSECLDLGNEPAMVLGCSCAQIAKPPKGQEHAPLQQLPQKHCPWICVFDSSEKAF